jgi:hypothetical protein
MLPQKLKPRNQDFYKYSATPPALGPAGFEARANGGERFAPVSRMNGIQKRLAIAQEREQISSKPVR